MEKITIMGKGYHKEPERFLCDGCDFLTSQFCNSFQCPGDWGIWVEDNPAKEVIQIENKFYKYVNEPGDCFKCCFKTCDKDCMSFTCGKGYFIEVDKPLPTIEKEIV